MNDHPKTPEELLERIQAHIRKPEELWAEANKTEDPWTSKEAEQGYAAAADALWKVALDAFNYACHVVSPSGFQASYAALHFYGEAMGVKGPYSVVKAQDLLYPQYDPEGRLHDFLHSDDVTRWLGDQAEKLLAERDSAVEAVTDHWKRLIEARDALPKEETNA